METLLQLVQTINGYLSDYVLIIMLIGAGLYFSIKTRFIQVRCFGEGMRHVFGNFSLHGGKHDSGMSSFQALTTAIAAQVGTGNIVGACGAILIGGPEKSRLTELSSAVLLSLQKNAKNKKTPGSSLNTVVGVKLLLIITSFSLNGNIVTDFVILGGKPVYRKFNLLCIPTAFYGLLFI